MGAMEDVFGAMPNRPDHPDFWRLSELILGYTGSLNEAADKDEFWEKYVDGLVDRASLTYMSMQRAMQVLGIATVGEIVAHMDELSRLTTVYAEGFLMGAKFEQAGGKQ